eukprot:CAMPEP_0172474788 /NCGR_PEP_ID=MMETSP1065-20121228/69537_1 /TAXON_ID=265537 /ORGANISM="Amphiprora paludosa, Strain CCMP125" /LENGTH=396 /DNA_ID=CAMNT_0013232979 /DNA_START=31 /DNA_END=1221 /DNA_ORIENTATION=+
MTVSISRALFRSTPRIVALTRPFSTAASSSNDQTYNASARRQQAQLPKWREVFLQAQKHRALSSIPPTGGDDKAKALEVKAVAGRQKIDESEAPAAMAAPASFSLSASDGDASAKSDERSKALRKHANEMTKLMGESLQPPAGKLVDESTEERMFIPEVSLHASDGRGSRKRVLILCTGGTLTMAPRESDGALAPVEGALSSYMEQMSEIQDNPQMPDYVLHEYTPFYDSSDLGPADWARIAHDIRANYLQFDGFVVAMGTDTMSYCATALSFMLENLGKPVVFTGSQIPLCEPYNDARRNLIMAMIFASRDTINEVTIFFHDRLLRACRSTKVNTHQLLAFDSPNMDPLAKIGITIDENEHLILPPPRGSLRVHSRMDTRLLTIRLVPGFDDSMM